MVQERRDEAKTHETPDYSGLFSADAIKTLETAFVIAHREGRKEIGAEHILLAIRDQKAPDGHGPQGPMPQVGQKANQLVLAALKRADNRNSTTVDVQDLFESALAALRCQIEDAFGTILDNPGIWKESKITLLIDTWRQLQETINRAPPTTSSHPQP